MNKKEIKAAVEAGQIHCRIMFQVVGAPKEHVEQTLKSYIATIESGKEYTIIDADYSPAEKEDQFFSAFVDVDMLVKNPDALTELCFNYMPSSIEFIDPKEVIYKRKQLDSWFNDLLAKLHEISMLSKQVAAQNKTVVTNMNNLIKNAIVFGTEHGKTVAEIAKSLGMSTQNLEPFFKALIKEGRLSEKGKAKKKAGKK